MFDKILNEKLLHLVWERIYINTQNIKTVCGKNIYILSPGIYNPHQGGDFINAHLVIDDIEWHGSVEIHLTSEEWYKHEHHKDPFYNSIILHVVYQSTQTSIIRQDGTVVPELEINKILLPNFFNFVQRFNTEPILCKAHLDQLDSSFKKGWLQELGKIRLERKAQNLYTQLIQNQNDWNETLWQEFAAYFGGNVNSEPFRRIARNIPYRLIAKYLHQKNWIEALLLGGAGLLDNQDFPENYPRELLQNWQFLAAKHGLHALPPGTLSFLRIRPASFPTLRLAQLAAFLVANPLSTNLLLEPLLITKADIRVSEYWQTHYHFARETKRSAKKPGKAFLQTLMINALLPLSWLYAQLMQKPVIQTRIINIAQNLTPEENYITKIYRQLNFPITSLLESQATIELYQRYCKNYLCACCEIGKKLIQQNV
ncbi:MAG: DUF2851 family protein [Bacteroidia bacterium]|nr:DUF2851 family protein [Bacteroidia bacterium]MDW8157404.1 DUF2851 family protein [Bacteroidia bacterium]